MKADPKYTLYRKLTPSRHLLHSTLVNSKWISDLNKNAKFIKLLKNIGIN